MRTTLLFRLERPLAAVAIPFLGGAFLVSPQAFAQLFLVAVLVVLLLTYYKTCRVLFALCLLCGMLHGGLYRVMRPVKPEEMDGKTVSAVGTVVSPVYEGNTLRCILDDAVLSTGEENVKIRVTMYETDYFAEGDQIEIQGVCHMEQGGFFDLYRYYYENGVDLFLSGRTVLKHTKALKKPFSAHFTALREYYAQAIEQMYSEEDAPLLCGILLGDGKAISEQSADVFNRTGIRHLFVVSGMHISMAAGAVHLLLQKLKLPRRFCAVSAILSAVFFVMLTGCGIPAIRAGIMTASVFLGRIFFRKSDPLNSLCGAGMLIVLAAPYAVTSASFLLSFAATAGLFLISPALLHWINGRLPSGLRRLSSFFAALTPTLGAGIAILPLSIAFFGGFSLISPVANLLAAPFFPIILCSGYLSLTNIPILANMAAQLVTFCLALFNGGIQMLAELPFSFLGTRSPFVTCFFFIACGVIFLHWMYHRKTEFLIKTGMFLAMAFPIAVILVQQTASFPVVCSAFVTGASQVVVLEQGRTADLIIVEESRGWGGDVLSFLRSRNIYAIRSIVMVTDENTSSLSMALLTENFPVQSVAFYAENPFGEYAQGRLPLRRKPILLWENTSQRISSDLELKRENGGFSFLMHCQDRTICISDSFQPESCDVQLLCLQEEGALYLSDDTSLVILQAPDAFTVNGGKVFSAEKGILSLYFKDDGTFGVWRY